MIVKEMRSTFYDVHDALAQRAVNVSVRARVTRETLTRLLLINCPDDLSAVFNVAY